MHLVELTCRGFRALDETCFRPARGLNVVHGDNAQGKTSLLEAVLFAATSKSHRTNTESELVGHEQTGFFVQIHAQRRDRDVRIEASWHNGVKRFRVNGIAQARTSDLLGKVNVVLFAPEDVYLVRGAASHRRKFMDMELSQLVPNYLHALQQYRQALRQRNELLRQGAPDGHLLDAWDAQLARHGEVIVRERAAFIAELGRRAASAYRSIADGETLGVAFCPNVSEESSLQEALVKARVADVRRGVTTRGPHRDDVAFSVARDSARHFASQGQQRTAALAVKLAEVEWVRERTGEYPILMLDEALAELDSVRANRLLNALDKDMQCILTTTDRTQTDAGRHMPVSHFVMARGRLEKR